MAEAETAAAHLLANFSENYRSSQKICKSEYGNRIWIQKNNEYRLESEVRETILPEPTAITRTVSNDQSIQTEEDICVSILEKMKANSKILINVFALEKSIKQ